MTNINLWNSSHHNALPNISALDELQKTTSENVKKPEDGNPFLEGGELPDLGEFFTEMANNEVNTQEDMKNRLLEIRQTFK